MNCRNDLHMVLLDWATPSHHPFWIGIFHEINQPFRATPMTSWKPPYPYCTAGFYPNVSSIFYSLRYQQKHIDQFVDPLLFFVRVVSKITMSRNTGECLDA